MAEVRPGTPRNLAKAAPEMANPPSDEVLRSPDDVKDSDLSVFEAARTKAPSLTKEFVAKHKLDDDDLMEIAVGSQPPPPFVPENDFTELHRTGGGWTVTAKGAKP